MHVHDILYNIIMRCKADELGKLKLGFGGKQHDELFISPRRMREGYGSRSVCVSVITPAATYLQLVYTMQTRRHYRLLWHLQGVNCVENASWPADPCITSLVYRVMRLHSQFIKSPKFKIRQYL